VHEGRRARRPCENATIATLIGDQYMLRAVLRDLLWPRKRPADSTSLRPRVLNVGGGNKSVAIPPHYDGWDHLLLDIDPAGAPDIVCDARTLESFEDSQFDAVYCSHNLEHYHRHDGARVLRGFLHVLKPHGFAEILVPDIRALVQHVADTGGDLDDILYVSQMGPIAVTDMIYGLGRQIEESGNDFYAHKTGFSPRLLSLALERAGFARVIAADPFGSLEIRAIAFKAEPTPDQLRALNLPPS